MEVHFKKSSKSKCNLLLLMKIVLSKKFLVKILYIITFLFWITKNVPAIGQNFYSQKEMKKEYIKLGMGAGNFFASPIIGSSDIKGKILPGLNLGIGTKISPHLSLQTSGSIQHYSGYEFLNPDLINDLNQDQIYRGYSYSLDFMPVFNLIPYRYYKKRPNINWNLGIGLGYIWTYQTEKFEFNDKHYEFSFFRSSFFIPIRSSLEFKLNLDSYIELEGTFFYTWLSGYDFKTKPVLYNNHFIQLNVFYKRYIRWDIF